MARMRRRGDLRGAPKLKRKPEAPPEKRSRRPEPEAPPKRRPKPQPEPEDEELDFSELESDPKAKVSRRAPEEARREEPRAKKSSAKAPKEVKEKPKKKKAKKPKKPGKLGKSIGAFFKGIGPFITGTWSSFKSEMAFYWANIKIEFAYAVKEWKAGDTLGDKALNILFALCKWIHLMSGYYILVLSRFFGKVLGATPWSCRLGILFTALAGLCINIAPLGQEYFVNWAELRKDHITILEQSGIWGAFEPLAWLAWGVGGMLYLAALLSFVKTRFSYFWMKVSAAAFTVVWVWVFLFIVKIPTILLLSDEETFDKTMRDDIWLFGVYDWLHVFAINALLLLCLILKRVKKVYHRRWAEHDLRGDRILYDIETHGDDPRYRTSSYWSWFIHIFYLFLWPLLLRGCLLEPYAIPQGSGNPVVEVVKVKKVKKKKQDELVFNPNSAISFYKPEIDESKVMEEVEEETLDTYEATMNKKSGKLGKGGGKKGGWPNGMPGKVRFIRLKYSGGDWDQDMGKGSDYNFLLKFQELTGFKVAKNTEYIEIRDLRRFPKDRAPPFVYLTGKTGTINASRRDIKTLRWYLTEEGGMIFADNGGGNFNRSFRSLMRRVFPDKKWIDIANDDIIYRQPYGFPRGAPPLWHHSGYRALGMKENGRWLVFYHQGDINDAWKTGGSGVKKSTQAAAFKLGINIVNYAFNQYLSIHFPDK